MIDHDDFDRGAIIQEMDDAKRPCIVCWPLLARPPGGDISPVQGAVEQAAGRPICVRWRFSGGLRRTCVARDCQSFLMDGYGCAGGGSVLCRRQLPVSGESTSPLARRRSRIVAAGR